MLIKLYTLYIQHYTDDILQKLLNAFKKTTTQNRIDESKDDLMTLSYYIVTILLFSRNNANII